MKRFFILLVLGVLTGCGTPPAPTNHPLDTKEIASLTTRLQVIGGLADGTQASLNRTPPNVELAKGFNQGVQVLAEKPPQEVQKAVSVSLATDDPTKTLPWVQKAAESREWVQEERLKELTDLRKRALEGDRAQQRLDELNDVGSAFRHFVSVLWRKLMWLVVGFTIVGGVVTYLVGPLRILTGYQTLKKVVTAVQGFRKDPSTNSGPLDERLGRILDQHEQNFIADLKMRLKLK
jgi:hypothetical protein